MNNSQSFAQTSNSPTDNVKRIARYPKLVFDRVFAFAPNKDTLGGTAYLLIHSLGNILIDCPPWQEFNRQFCSEKGGVKYLFVTNRDGISKQIRKIQEDLNCNLIIQEQEAYLLPSLHPITFEQDYQIYDDCCLLWTPGYSPGSSCLYTSIHQGILFSGRHLLPTSPSEITPLRLKKTFHWQRQLKSLELLRNHFHSDNLQYILPGANTGYLRSKGFITRAYEKLVNLDLNTLKASRC